MKKMLWLTIISFLATPTGMWALEDLPQDMISFGVFVSYEDTSTLEKGSLSHFPPCTSCDSTQLPLDVDFVAPVDIGHVTYSYQMTGDTIYAATFFWQAPGEIIMPSIFMPADSFGLELNMAPSPLYLRTSVEDPELPMSEELLSEAMLFWDQLRQTSIIHEFAESYYSLWLTRFSTTDSTLASESHYRWIAIVYRNPIITSIDEQHSQKAETHVLKSCFPNPSNAGINLSYAISEELDLEFRVFNILGERVGSTTIKSQAAGEYTFRWNGIDEQGVDAQSGVYVIQLSTKYGNESTKILVIK